jgi:hypothetical protein
MPNRRVKLSDFLRNLPEKLDIVENDRSVILDSQDSNTLKSLLSPVSQKFVEDRTEELVNESLADKADQSALTSHEQDEANPHGVTQAQVGLDQVDNTSDVDKPVSTAQQNALNEKADQSALNSLSNEVDSKADQSALTSHEQDEANPHGVTQAQVGLDQVDNTSDVDKPVSTAQQNALNDKADQSALNSLSNEVDSKADQSALTSHEQDEANPHGVTQAQVGLDQVDNTSDADKPVSTAQQNALNDKADQSALNSLSNEVDSKADQSALTSHEQDEANPHGVTQAQVGLDQVDNTSDADKPVSTAQQNALNDKASLSSVDSIEDLKAFNVNPLKNGDTVNVLGYYEPGDGGGGGFYWDVDSEEDDNGGTVIQADGAAVGRWKRKERSALHLSDFGVLKGVSDAKEHIEKAHDYAFQKNIKKIIYPDGVINVTRGMELYLKDGTDIQAAGCCFNDISEYGGGTIVDYKKEHDFELLTELSDEAAEGAMSLELSAVTGVSPGMIIVVNPGSREHTEMGEVNLIDYIEGNSVYLASPIKTDYSAGEGIRCFEPGRDVSVTGLAIKTNGKSLEACRFSDLINSDFNHIYIDDDIYARYEYMEQEDPGLITFSRGLRLNNVYACSVNHFKATKARYGLYVNESSHVQVNQSRGYNSWHTFEHTGWNWDVVYNDCFTVNDSYGFRAHEGGRYVFNRCITYGGKGFYVQGWHAEYNDCMIVDGNAEQAILQRDNGEKVFKPSNVKSLKINGFYLDAYGATPDDLIFHHETTADFGADRFGCKIDIRDMVVNIRKGQVVRISDFKELKGRNITFNVLEYHDTDKLDAIDFTNFDGDGAIVDVDGFYINNYCNRVFGCRLTKEGSAQIWKNVNIRGKSVDTESASHSYLWSSQSNNLGAISFYNLTVDLDDEKAGAIFRLYTDDNIHVDTAKLIKGASSEMFLISGVSTATAVNAYSLSHADVFRFRDDAEMAYVTNTHKGGAGFVFDNEYGSGVGPVIVSPDGTKYRLVADNSGVVSGSAL